MSDSELQNNIDDVSTRALTGAHPVLEAQLALLQRGVSLSKDVRDALSVRLDVPGERVNGVAAWLERTLAKGSKSSSLKLCKSVSCTKNGASRLHERFQAALAALGADGDVEYVYCLSQCEVGPSMACGDRIYVGGQDDVVHDERPWLGES